MDCIVRVCVHATPASSPTLVGSVQSLARLQLCLSEYFVSVGMPPGLTISRRTMSVGLGEELATLSSEGRKDLLDRSTGRIAA